MDEVYLDYVLPTGDKKLIKQFLDELFGGGEYTPAPDDVVDDISDEDEIPVVIESKLDESVYNPTTTRISNEVPLIVESEHIPHLSDHVRKITGDKRRKINKLADILSTVEFDRIQTKIDNATDDEVGFYVFDDKSVVLACDEWLSDQDAEYYFDKAEHVLDNYITQYIDYGSVLTYEIIFKYPEIDQEDYRQFDDRNTAEGRFEYMKDNFTDFEYEYIELDSIVTDYTAGTETRTTLDRWTLDDEEEANINHEAERVADENPVVIEDVNLNESANVFDNDEDYKKFIYPEMIHRYHEYISKGYDLERIKAELFDEFGYQDLVDKIVGEEYIDVEVPTVVENYSLDDDEPIYDGPAVDFDALKQSNF